MFRRSRLLARIRDGKVARLCATGSFTTYMPAIAAHLGYDAVWVDAEHRAWNANEAREMLLRHHLADIDCVFRPPTTERATLSRLLEDGATGLMIPMVNTGEQAQHLAQCVKFPPLGERGLDGTALDAGFWVGKDADYTQLANRETALVAQIETPMALENMADIAGVEGVDILFMGPGDLSLRLGCPPSLAEPPLRTALEKLAGVCAEKGKPWGCPVGSIEDARLIIDMGAKFVVYGSEFFSVRKQLGICASELNQLLGDE